MIMNNWTNLWINEHVDVPRLDLLADNAQIFRESHDLFRETPCKESTSR